MPNSIAQRQLETIDEQWRANHLEAMSCCRLEDVLLLCIQAFEWINREDEGRRLQVLTSHDAAVDDEQSNVANLYSKWNGLCPKFLEPVRRFESRGYTVEYSERFRACIREVQGILTGDSDFFQGNALVNLCDDAIDEFRRGEAEDVNWAG